MLRRPRADPVRKFDRTLWRVASAPGLASGTLDGQARFDSRLEDPLLHRSPSSIASLRAENYHIAYRKSWLLFSSENQDSMIPRISSRMRAAGDVLR